MKYFRLILLCAIAGLLAPLWAEEEDSSAEERRGNLEEELALVRDSYITPLTEAMESAFKVSPEEWLSQRAAGQFATWKDFDFEAPSTPDFGLTEKLYGFLILDKASGETCRVRVVTRDMDLFYDLEFSKKAPQTFRNLVQEVFANGEVVYYDQGSPCTKQAVTCINEYEQGTLGKTESSRKTRSKKAAHR